MEARKIPVEDQSLFEAAERKRLIERTRAEVILENNHLKNRIAALELQLSDIVESRSWKITEPLRQFTKNRKRLFPLWRRGAVRCGLSAVQGMKVNRTGEDSFELSVVGPAAKIGLEAASFPEGTVSFEAFIDKPFVSFLYYRTGEQFGDSQRISLTLLKTSDEGKASVLMYFPRGIKEIHIVPLHGDGTFRFSDIRLRPLGTAQVIAEFAAGKVIPALKNRAELGVKTKKAWAIYREGGVAALRSRIFASQLTNNYFDWVGKYDTFTQNDKTKIAKFISGFSLRPKISILMPTYNTPIRWLTAAIESVRAQVYDNWELCIADDASVDPEVRTTLEEYTKKDSRIKVVLRKENGHISKTSNDALKIATGEFIALLDHDDELTPDALALVVHAINQNPAVDFIYSDEDKMTSYGMRFNPHFKSNWNPELFLSQNYICHLGVYRKKLVDEVGGFREGVEGAQDWDLALRISEKIPENHIKHIPHVLYHWRVIQGSTAHSTAAKPYVLEAQRKSVGEHLERRGIKAHVSILPAISHVRPHFELPAKLPFVSIIIPTRNQIHHMKRCIESITENTTYAAYEIILIDNNSDCLETLEYLDELKQRKDIRVVRDNRPFNYSRLNNEAVTIARGEYIALLNNDLQVITPEWLSEMVSVAIQPGIGAVGARLLYPNGLLQHGGVILGIGGVAGHNNKGRLRHDPGYFNRCILLQDFSAVTAACMVVSKKVFQEVGGLDETDLAVAFNDVDFCLKVREKGLRIVYNPYAELYHFESASRGYENTPEKYRRFEKEISAMKKRWASQLANDPYYNPNLTIVSEDFQFAFPPRVKRPWR